MSHCVVQKQPRLLPALIPLTELSTFACPSWSVRAEGGAAPAPALSHTNQPLPPTGADPPARECCDLGLGQPCHPSVCPALHLVPAQTQKESLRPPRGSVPQPTRLLRPVPLVQARAPCASGPHQQVRPWGHLCVSAPRALLSSPETGCYAPVPMSPSRLLRGHAGVGPELFLNPSTPGSV